jgi:hypothetical protein
MVKHILNSTHFLNIRPEKSLDFRKLKTKLLNSIGLG